MPVFGILATDPHNACFTASFSRPTYIIAIRKIKKIKFLKMSFLKHPNKQSPSLEDQVLEFE